MNTADETRKCDWVLLAKVIVLVIFASHPGVAAWAKDERVKDRRTNAENEEDVRKLQGTWKMKSFLVDGKSSEGMVEVTFRRNTFQMRFEPRMPGEAHVIEFSFEVDASKKPKEIRKTIVSHVNAGQSSRGIYELKANVLEMSFHTDEKLWSVPPKKFDARKGAGQIVMKLEREERVVLDKGTKGGRVCGRNCVASTQEGTVYRSCGHASSRLEVCCEGYR